MENFKQASKEKLRIQTNKGLLSVEQLWDLSLSDLDILAVSLENEYKESGKKSFDSKTRLDAWIESATTDFGETSDITDATFPPKLTINRDVVKSPMTATDCEGKADTVILQPSDAFINKYLPIKSAKWPAGTSGQLFWPTVK